MTEVKEKLLINIEELSELTGLAVGSLYHMVSQRRIPCVRLSQRCLRFSVPAIREWLDGLSERAVTGK
jgi:predicted DNA-binding transcriptional regulator AlpA